MLDKLFPTTQTDEMRLKVRSVLNRILYTGDIKEDGSFEYINPDSALGKGFLMLPSKEEKTKFSDIQFQGKLSKIIGIVVCQNVSDFYKYIFERFLETTLIIDPDNVLALKYILLKTDKRMGIDGISKLMMY